MKYFRKYQTNNKIEICECGHNRIQHNEGKGFCVGDVGEINRDLKICRCKRYRRRK